MKAPGAIVSLCVAAALILSGCSPSDSGTGSRTPNIIFFVMDDVGIDQMQLYGYGNPGVAGVRKTRMPNIEAVARKGVIFTNAWAMPDCSPSRATFFTGQMPARTNIFNAIQPPDLAIAQVSPYLMTLPKLLKTKGYVNALIGKMHLSGSEQEPGTNPLGNETYRELGFDYFNGYLDGAPLPINTTAGLKSAAPGTYGCGYIPNKASNSQYGADAGTCYYANGTSAVMTTAQNETPGRSCLESGGILDPTQPPSRSNVDFNADNGYYTARWVENLEDGVTTKTYLPGDPTVDPAQYRGYRSTVEANRAISWINKEKQGDKPWMISVGFSSSHSPWQSVPKSILPTDSVNTDGYNCSGGANNDELRVLMQQMDEGLDRELGRILVETGTASYNQDGSLNYDPQKSNTLIVIVADNGTYGPVVNPPFDGTRAKGSPYQTGVSIPLIVSGPMVNSPGREVSAMVNAMDLYKLFAEVAGIDAEAVVPKSQRLDAKSMLAYLTQPQTLPMRLTDLTQSGDNERLPAVMYYTPCLVEAYNAVTMIFPSQAICRKNAGIWYGPGSPVAGVPAEGLQDGCAVNAFRTANGMPAVQIDPVLKMAIRDIHYKVVELLEPDCSTPIPRKTTTTYEFYQIDQQPPTPKLDTMANNLLKDGSALVDSTPILYAQYKALTLALAEWRSTVAPACPGDGNSDRVVDAKDIDGFRRFAARPLGTGTGQSSWFDFNNDGKTDATDLAIITSNWGRVCTTN